MEKKISSQAGNSVTAPQLHPPKCVDSSTVLCLEKVFGPFKYICFLVRNLKSIITFSQFFYESHPIQLSFYNIYSWTAKDLLHSELNSGDCSDSQQWDTEPQHFKDTRLVKETDSGANWKSSTVLYHVLHGLSTSWSQQIPSPPVQPKLHKKLNLVSFSANLGLLSKVSPSHKKIFLMVYFWKLCHNYIQNQDNRPSDYNLDLKSTYS